MRQLTLLLPYPAPDGGIERNVAFARDTAAACAEHSGDLLPFVTTANTVCADEAMNSFLATGAPARAGPLLPGSVTGRGRRPLRALAVHTFCGAASRLSM
ncbi:hypothetical protein AB0B89_00305 [Sphaerisporangium sp. NPDC049002]